MHRCAHGRESGRFLPKRNWTAFLAQELLAVPGQGVRDGHAERTKPPIRALGWPWVDYRGFHRKEKMEKERLVGKGVKKMPEKGGLRGPFSNRQHRTRFKLVPAPVYGAAKGMPSCTLPHGDLLCRNLGLRCLKALRAAGYRPFLA
jgi:hypothetical protein